jgi:hypothetical protein
MINIELEQKKIHCFSEYLNYKYNNKNNLKNTFYLFS